MPPTERTPLLDTETITAEQPPKDHNDIYDKYDKRTKRAILAMVSLSGVLPLFVGGSFVPSIPQIAKDFETTGAVISLAVSVSICAHSIGSLSGATYAGFYGRRAVFLYSLPVAFLGSVGVALSRTIPQLMIWRFLQAMGTAPGLSVGAGSVGDVYRLEERGRAMSVFFSACLVGPALAPMTGGFAAQYLSWRLMQFSLGVVGLILYALMYFFLPETTHPGILLVEKYLPKDLPKWRPVILNPLKPLGLLRSPIFVAMGVTTTTSLFTYQVLLIPLAYTLGARYGVKNEALLGACFLPAGLGNMVAAPVIGRISDMTVIKWRKRRNGVWYPEDRLRPALPWLLTLVPLSCLASGVLSTYGTGRLGLFLNLCCLFLNGFGIEMVWGPCAAYMVDVVHSRSAETMAANAGMRSLLLTGLVASIIPLIDTFGVVATNTFAASMAVGGFCILYSTIKYGDRLRAFVDVGFSTADNN